MGNVFDDVVDAASDAADAVADVATSVVDRISDAGKAIGSVLKFVAPIVALWPGIGTALSIALEAAAAYACQDSIDDAVIEIASAAIPGGVPRAAFDGAAAIAQAAVKGENVGEAAIRACRSVASSAGGDRAVAAFDAAIAVAKGDKVGGSMWALARKSAAQGGPAELAAFDAGYAVAQGGNAGDAVLAAARSYIASAGGPIAAAAFDGGVAIARGKALQDAGFDALKAFASGNDLAERAVVFADKIARAARRGVPLEQVLVGELAEDVIKYGGALARSEGTKAFVASQLGPILDHWPSTVSLNGIDVPIQDVGSFDLAAILNVDEVIARAAQAIMRALPWGGAPDQALRDHLTKTGLQSAIDSFGIAVVAARATNATYTATKAQQHTDLLLLALRLNPRALSYETAVAEAANTVGLVARAPPPNALAIWAAGNGQVAGAPPPAPVQQAPAPAKPRTGTAGNVALGLTIAGAAIALAWWSTSK